MVKLFLKWLKNSFTIHCDMRDYGTMNGKAVFEMAKKLIGD